MGKYDDIINLPHPVSKTHAPMPRAQRAAQFSPFAALTGYEFLRSMPVIQQWWKKLFPMIEFLDKKIERG